MIDFGDLVPRTVQITDAAGAPANPGGITLTITLPDGTTATPTPTPNGTGLFQVDYAPTMAGRHPYRWVATGANASAYSGVFDVRPADPGYIVSLADAKAHLNKTTGNSPDDEELRGFVEYATEKIEDWTGVTYARRTFSNERHTVAYGTSDVPLYHGPITSVASITSADATVTWTPGNFSLDGRWVRRVSGSYLYGDVLFTYTAATIVTPAKVIVCAKEIIRWSWDSQRQPGLGPSPFTQEGFAPQRRGGSIDDLLEEMLGARPPMVA